MKILTACAAAALAFALPPAALAQSTDVSQKTELQLSQEIIDRGFPADDRRLLFTSVAREMMTQLRASVPAEARHPALDGVLDAHQQRVLAVMEKLLAVHLDSLMKGMTAAYSETFSRDELEGLHGFIMSPVGEGFLARSAAAMSHPAFAKANQEYMADFMSHVPSLEQELQADLKAAVSKN